MSLDNVLPMSLDSFVTYVLDTYIVASSQVQTNLLISLSQQAYEVPRIGKEFQVFSIDYHGHHSPILEYLELFPFGVLSFSLACYSFSRKYDSKLCFG